MSGWTALLAGVALFVALQAAFWISRARARSRRARLAARMALPAEGGDGASLDARDLRLSKNPAIQAILADWPFTRALATILLQSGLKTTVDGLLAQMASAAAAILLIGIVLDLGAGLTLVLALIGVASPVLRVVNRRSQRISKFAQQLPQALEVLSLFLRAGRSLPQALEGMTENLPALIGEEFKLCMEEYRLGRPIDQALRNLAERYPTITGLRLFVSGATVLGQTGGNLLEVIERIRKTIDMEDQYALRLRALTGETRMSATFLTALPGAFIALSLLLNPSYMGVMLETGLGHVLMALALLLWLGGALWIRLLLSSRLA